MWLEKHIVTHAVVSSRCEQCVEPEFYCAVAGESGAAPPPQTLIQRPFCRGKCVNNKRFETEGDNLAIDQACDFLFRNTSNYNGIVLAHNAGGYDAHFILEWLLKNREAPSLISNGSKFFQITQEGRTATNTGGPNQMPAINKIKILDSFHFTPIGLSKFAQTFGLRTRKGFFPVLSNCPKFWNDHSGNWPDLKYFSAKNAKDEREIQEFLDEKRRLGIPFNFREEIFKYCESDVQVCSISHTETILDFP